MTHLLDLAAEIRSDVRPVLFPTSDRMVKAIAEGWPQLEPHYVLSWSHCRELVATLQRKDSLAGYAERAAVRYPRSRMLSRPEEIHDIVRDLAWPALVKPAQPLSSFKAIKVRTPGELEDLVRSRSGDLPFVIQEWIEGDQCSLYSCTTYLDRGKAVFLFPSRKLDALPPGLGQGTVFEQCADDGFCELATRFLSQFDLSGPVAVEFKKDPQGRYWLIEPNVGRTEYCVDLVIQSGINLPYIEYLFASGQGHLVEPQSIRRDCVWYDTDKDPTCFARHVNVLFQGARGPRRPVFPYLGHADWKPVEASLRQVTRRGLHAMLRRARRRAPA